MLVPQKSVQQMSVQQMSVQQIPTALTLTNAPQIMTASMIVVPILIASTHHQVTRVAARLVTPVFLLISTTDAKISTNVVMEAMTVTKKPLALTWLLVTNVNATQDIRVTVLHVKMLTNVLRCMAKMLVTRVQIASVKTLMDLINVYAKRDIFQPAMTWVIHSKFWKKNRFLFRVS